MKRLLQVTFAFAVLACLAAGSASALTFQDRTCDNSKPTCVIPAGNAEVPYQFDMYARSGCPPYHYNFTGGTPPPGLTLSTVNDSSSGGIGRLHGTPTTPGHYQFYVTITTPESPTCLGDRADRLFEITIGPAPLAIKTSSLRRGVVGAAYTETLTASGGGNQTWSASGLPAGLAVSGSTITGTPTTAGNYTVTVTVNNGTSSRSAQYTLQVIDPLKVTGPGARPAEVGKLFTATFQATGGLGTYSWAVSEVPAGLTFDPATHVLSGTPSVAGPYTVKVTTTDGAAGLTQNLIFKVNVAAHIAIKTTKLKAATVGKPYLLKLKTTGGVKRFKWRSLGKLPAGLKLDARTGAIAGTPTKAGKLTVAIRVTDGLRVSATQTFTITVR
ncbi:MAG: putative Ig domain-containing protein [Actinobacteria bacterium]|nr:putative Ig domain-containing protein [Actinomycetota bacterium]